MAMILRVTDVKLGCKVSCECVGIRLTGQCVERDIGARFVRWQDGSIGRVTDGFIRECSSFAIHYA